MVFLRSGLVRPDFHRPLNSATKMTGRPGQWSEPGEFSILFLGSILVISSQDSSALGCRKFTQEGAMTTSPFAAREGTSAPQWPNIKKCCRHLVPSSVFFVQSYTVPINGPFRGAVFRHGRVPENRPLALMGRFPSLMGRFPTLVSRFPECLDGPFSLLKMPWKTALS